MTSVLRYIELSYRVWLGGKDDWHGGPLEAVVHPLKQMALDAGVDTTACFIRYRAEYTRSRDWRTVDIHDVVVSGVCFSAGGAEHLLDDGLISLIQSHLGENMYDYAERVVQEG